MRCRFQYIPKCGRGDGKPTSNHSISYPKATGSCLPISLVKETESKKETRDATWKANWLPVDTGRVSDTVFLSFIIWLVGALCADSYNIKRLGSQHTCLEWSLDFWINQTNGIVWLGKKYIIINIIIIIYTSTRGAEKDKISLPFFPVAFSFRTFLKKWIIYKLFNEIFRYCFLFQKAH